MATSHSSGSDHCFIFLFAATKYLWQIRYAAFSLKVLVSSYLLLYVIGMSGMGAVMYIDKCRLCHGYSMNVLIL